MKNHDTENDDGIYFEIGTEFESFHVNMLSKLPLSLRHRDPIAKSEELLARQLLL